MKIKVIVFKYIEELFDFTRQKILCEQFIKMFAKKSDSFSITKNYATEQTKCMKH